MITIMITIKLLTDNSERCLTGEYNNIISLWLQCLSLLFGSQKYKQVNRFYPLQWGIKN